MVNQRLKDGRSPAEAGAGLRPFGVEPAAPSQAEPLAPNAAEIITSADALLHPTTGAMRGLFGDDPASKLLRIRVGELRRFDTFVQQAKALAQAIEARRAATGTGAVHESAVAASDAPTTSQGPNP